MNETVTLAEYFDTAPVGIDTGFAHEVWDYMSENGIECDTDDDGNALLTTEEWETVLRGMTAERLPEYAV